MIEEDHISPVLTEPTGVASFSRSSTAADEAASPSSPPFQRDRQLCEELQYSADAKAPPCIQGLGITQNLPDAPRVRLDCPSTMLEYCLLDLDTPEMNRLGERLWWAGPTPNVVSLMQHMVLARQIQVTEDSSVHLLWTDSVIYIKPLPAYLSSYAFWDYLLDSSTTNTNPEERKILEATSLSFLKTYASLIQRRSDFILA
jgi:hypothetical protein